MIKKKIWKMLYIFLFISEIWIKVYTLNIKYAILYKRMQLLKSIFFNVFLKFNLIMKYFLSLWTKVKYKKNNVYSYLLFIYVIHIYYYS